MLFVCLAPLTCCSVVVEDPDAGLSGDKVPMSFSSNVAATRGFITSNMVDSEGTILRLADIVTIDGVRSPYFAPDAQNVGSRGSDLFRKTGFDWLRYRNVADYGGHYMWTSKGVHKFFGWARGVKLDPNDQGNTAVEQMITDYQLNVSTNPSVLDIRSLTLTDATTPQFDFIYTDVVMRNLDDLSQSYPSAASKFAPVPLTFHHLFSGLAVSVENRSPQTVIVEDLKVKGLKTTSSATITFNDIDLSDPTGEGSGSTVSIPRAVGGTMTEAVGGFIASTIRGSIPPQVVNNGVATYSKLDVFRKDASGVSRVLSSGEDNECRLLWPQSAGSLELVLRYKDSEASSTVKTKTITVDLPSELGLGKFEAGKKYRINILFKGDNIPLNCNLNVLPWDTEENTLDIAIKCNPSLSLSYDDGTGEKSLVGEDIAGADLSDPSAHKKRAAFPPIQDQYIKCTFTPLAPQGGEWRCEILDGNNAFTFVDNPTDQTPGPDNDLELSLRRSGTIDGSEQTLYLKPTGFAKASTTDVDCCLGFHVLSGNVDADVTAQFNPENYLFVYSVN